MELGGRKTVQHEGKEFAELKNSICKGLKRQPAYRTLIRN